MRTIGLLMLVLAGVLALWMRRKRGKAVAIPTGHSTFASFWLRVVLVFAMALPMLVLYAVSTLGLLLSKDLQFKPEWLGYLVMSSFGLASLLSLWAGALVDRLGSRYALIILFASIAGAFTVIVTATQFYALVIAAAICGIAQALANPVTNLLIAQHVPQPQRAGVVGLKQSGVQLAALFAGLVLPNVAFAYSWRTAFFPIIPVAVLFTLTTPFITPKKHLASGKGFGLSLPNGLLFRLMGIQCCVGIALSAFVTFLPTFATQQAMALPLAGSLIAIFGVMGIISRIVLTPLGAKLKDESHLLLALIAIAAVAMAVTLQANPASHWQLWAGAVGVGLTAVGTNAIAMSMLIRDARFGTVTVASGLVSVAFFGGFAAGPPLYGWLSDYTGSVQSSWYAMITVLLTGCFLASGLSTARYRKGQEQIVDQLKNEISVLGGRLAAMENHYRVLTAESVLDSGLPKNKAVLGKAEEMALAALPSVKTMVVVKL